VAEINVQHFRIGLLQRREDAPRFRAVDGDWPVEHLLLHQAAELVRARFGQHHEFVERKLRRVLPLLAEDDRSKRPQSRDLPVDVQHLRFEESDHVLGGDGRLGRGGACHGCGCIYVPARMRREVEIVNQLGLHARPAAEFVRAVHKFKSEVTIRKGDEHFSGSSILEVLSANLDCGTHIVIEAIGADAEHALERLCALLLDFKLQEEDGRM